MPGRYYKHSHGPVDLYALDSGSMFFDGGLLCWDCNDIVDDMQSWLAGEWSGGSTGTWRIAYGHHPYLSNGPHGNAGSYEDENIAPWVPDWLYVTGQGVKDFLDAEVCGEVDLYLAGHDHSRQWLTGDCDGTALIVSGAGAKTTEIEGSNPVYFQDADTEGFFWFEIIGNTMTVETWNKNGTMDYSGTITK